MSTPDPAYIHWLEEQSMLYQAKPLARRYAGRGDMWQHPYAEAQPRAAAELASVWFTAYPASIITRDGESVLATLADPALWEAFATIGVKAVHTGPMKLGGGQTGRTFTPTIDGNFDRISFAIDPAFGSVAEFRAMSTNANAHGAIIIDDIVPGHTGKGADFRLAELGVDDYPGLYHMVAITPEDWPLLPDVADGGDAANLSLAAVDALAAQGYIVGRLSRTIFYEPGVKDTDWSATPVVTGADGVDRRWVYLHYFKAGQPTLNWLDATCAAQRLVLGDALHSMGELGASMLRLDANGFLGVECRPDGPAWSEGHPLSLTANQIIAGLVRKAGGFTFQELNLTVDDIATMSHGGADLAYDFITRPAYAHALVTGDTTFLRLMFAEMHAAEIDPAGLVHALQNHDELTLELVHFWTRHAQDVYAYQGREWTGLELREEIRGVMYERLTGPAAPYHRRFVTNGVASTLAGVCAATLGLTDLDAIGPDEAAMIQRLHLLLVMVNAWQPGVFALSGWDLVGALPLAWEAVAEIAGDGDTRWINRGAYDLMGVNPAAGASAAGLPRARALYGSLPDQLRRPDSFIHQLRRILEVRQRTRLYAARQLAVPAVTQPGLLVMLHELPDTHEIQATLLNFGAEPVTEIVSLPGVAAGQVVDLLTGEQVGVLSSASDLSVTLPGYSGRAVAIRKQG